IDAGREIPGVYECAQRVCGADGKKVDDGGVGTKFAFHAEWARQHLYHPAKGIGIGCPEVNWRVASRICASVLVGGSICLAQFCSGLMHAAGAETEAKLVPEMVGEGVVSTPDDEFGGTPAVDGTLYFDKTVPPHSLYVICESHQVNG